MLRRRPLRDLLPLRPLDALQRPLYRLLLHTIPLDDPWRRYPHPVPLHRFGQGARHDFGWYFEGESQVEVGSLAEIQTWLLGCRYRRDGDLFHEADFWQHPRTFERLRQGDCEDFALWAWRKLVRLGFEAEFVAGHRRHRRGPAEPHAWVLFRREGQLHVFEAVAREAERMVRPLAAVHERYAPEVAVDARLQRYVFAAYYRRLRARQRPTAGARRSWLRRLRAGVPTAAPPAA